MSKHGSLSVSDPLIAACALVWEAEEEEAEENRCNAGLSVSSWKGGSIPHAMLQSATVAQHILHTSISL